MKMLEAKHVGKRFGGLDAVHDVSLDVSEGEILGLIGPNGAGKTTFLSLLSGFLKLSAGEIWFRDRNVTRLVPDAKANVGIVRTFQADNVFKRLTVKENVLIGLHNRADLGFWGPVIPFLGTRHTEAVNVEAEQIISEMGLAEFRETQADSLPHGYQRLLGIAIALTGHPRLLLLDEPSTGMISEETQLLMSIVRKIREHGVSIIVVEHNMRVVMGLCDRITVLSFGEKIAEGIPVEIQCNEAVIEAYLGEDQGDLEQC